MTSPAGGAGTVRGAPQDRQSCHGAARLRDDRAVAVGIFFLALAIYILTYNGAFKSNDERALFAGTDSFVKRGAFTVNQLYWDYTNVGMLTGTGEKVPNYEPAQMVLVIPLYVWGRALAAGVQGVMFFGALVTAAAVALLYLCVLELGYARRTAAALALVFALATEAWPFARTFFREPLTMASYMLAFYALLRYQPPASRALRWLVLAGTALGIAVTNKQTSVAIVPALLVLIAAAGWQRSDFWPAQAGRTWREIAAALVARWRRPESWRKLLAPAAAFLLPLAAILGLYGVYYLLTLSDVNSFARDVAEYATNPQLSTSKLGQMLYAFLGLSISPYKGLLWYSPVLLLAFLGVWPCLRRTPWAGAACLVAIAVHLLGYSRYLYWSGGVVWGSRYLLVIVPFCILLMAPVFAWLLNDPAARRTGALDSGLGAWSPARSAAALGVGLLILLSAGVQILGISLDWQTYELRFLLTQAKVWGGVGEAITALYLAPAYSPVLGNLRLLLSGTQPLDFAWIQHRPQDAWAFLPSGLALALLGVLIAAAALAWTWRHPRHAPGLGLALSLAAIGLASALVLTYRQGDARFDPYGVDRFLRPMNAALAQAVKSGRAPCCRAGAANSAACAGVLIVPDPVLTDYYLNYLAAPLPWYDVYPRPVPWYNVKPAAGARPLLDQLAARYTDIWLARDRDAASDDAEGRRDTERYLAEHAYKLEEQRFGDWARLLHFSAAGQPAEVARPGASLGEMILDEAALNVAQRGLPPACPGSGGTGTPAAQPLDDGQVQAATGDILQIGLRWRALQKPVANYTVFLQLLDAGGQVKAQTDRWPGDGLYPTGSLAAGQAITDNLALRLEVPPGTYRLIAGLYRNDRPGLPRLTGPGGDAVRLAEVTVR